MDATSLNLFMKAYLRMMLYVDGAQTTVKSTKWVPWPHSLLRVRGNIMIPSRLSHSPENLISWPYLDFGCMILIFSSSKSVLKRMSTKILVSTRILQTSMFDTIASIIMVSL